MVQLWRNGHGQEAEPGRGTPGDRLTQAASGPEIAIIE